MVSVSGCDLIAKVPTPTNGISVLQLLVHIYFYFFLPDIFLLTQDLNQNKKDKKHCLGETKRDVRG